MTGSGAGSGSDEGFVAEAERARRAGCADEAERVARVGLGRCPGSLRGRVVLALALLDQDRWEEAREALLPVADAALCGTVARGFAPPPPPVPHESLAGGSEEPDLDAAFEGALAERHPTVSPDDLARLAVEEVEGPPVGGAGGRFGAPRPSREAVIATLERWLANLRGRTA